MENASKALIIAASVLLAIMLISVAVYVFRSGAKVLLAYDAGTENNELAKYNQKFVYYNRDDNNINDIISLCNLAYNYNINTDYDPDWAISIEVYASSNLSVPLFCIPNNSNCGLDKYQVHLGSQSVTDSSKNISIYNLSEHSIKDLFGNITLDKIYKNRYNDASISNPNGVNVVINNNSINLDDSLITTKLGTDYGFDSDGNLYANIGTTVYEVLFTTDVEKGGAFEYNISNSRVSDIKLIMYMNEDY